MGNNHCYMYNRDTLVFYLIKSLDNIKWPDLFPCKWYIIECKCCKIVIVPSRTHTILLGADKILIRRSSTAVALTETVNRTFVVSLVLYTQL